MDKYAIKSIAAEILLIDGQGETGHYFHGESMLPLFQEGDLLQVREPEDVSILRPGAIIIFKDGLNFPTRRIVERLHQSYLVVGDNWIDRPRTVVYNNVLGIVIKRTRGGQEIDKKALAWRYAKHSCLARYWGFDFQEVSLRYIRKAITKTKHLFNKVIS